MIGLHWRIAAACAALIIAPGAATPQGAERAGPAAQGPPPSSIWAMPDGRRANDGTVTVITAPAGGAMSVFGSDMARVLDDNETLRVLPILGKGPVQNVIDLLYLKSVDMGLVACDVREFFKLQYNVPDIASRLRYIAKLYHNEIHIVAPTSIRSIYDLRGKRIMAQRDVGYYSAKVIFSRLKIDADFDYQTDDASAIQAVVDGRADAYIGSSGKVFPLVRAIRNENRRLHFVPIDYDRRLQDLYLPTTFSSDEYPNLLAPGERVDTIAISVILATYNWPEHSERYNRIARFVDAFFSKIDEFHKPPRHPKWQEANIILNVPGWQRFKAAQDWIDRNRTSEGTREAEAASEGKFGQYLGRSGLSNKNLTPQEMQMLYKVFLERNRANR